jgi:hypothetical protein
MPVPVAADSSSISAFGLARLTSAAAPGVEVADAP